MFGLFICGWAVTGATDDASDCTNSLKVWCIVALILAMFHIFFALYYYFLFVKLGQDAGLALSPYARPLSICTPSLQCMPSLLDSFCDATKSIMNQSIMNQSCYLVLAGMQAVDMQQEARNIFCYDPWTAIYILIYIFSFVWGIVGSGWASDETGTMRSCPPCLLAGFLRVLLVQGPEPF